MNNELKKEFHATVYDRHSLLLLLEDESILCLRIQMQLNKELYCFFSRYEKEIRHISW